MQKTDEEVKVIVENIIDILDKEILNANDLVHIISTLLFSVGVSLENCGEITSEKVLTKFAMKPTLGFALMAQALHMKETWIKNERTKEDDGTTDNI